MSAIKNRYHDEICAPPADPDEGHPHVCRRCGDPNPDRLDVDGCRDPNCPEQGQ